MSIDRLPGFVIARPDEAIPESIRDSQSDRARKFALIGAPLGLGAGVVGGGIIGGVMQFNHDLNYRPGTGPFKTVLALGIIGGTIAGAIMGFSRGQESHDRDVALRGHTPADGARMLVDAFDHGRNGTIELSNPSGLPQFNEMFITEQKEGSRPQPGVIFRDGDADISVSTQSIPFERAASAKALFERADANGDADGVVTVNEVASVLATFDADGDDHISAAEQDAMRSAGLTLHTDWMRR